MSLISKALLSNGSVLGIRPSGLTIDSEGSEHRRLTRCRSWVTEMPMRTISVACLLLAACTPELEPTREVNAPTIAITATRPRAMLDFQPGWMQVQYGAIVRGGQVDVTYARSRLSACLDPTIISFARFTPGGQLFSSDEAFGFDVPADAASVELWFHALAPGCEQWDSNYGRNWKFPVLASPP
jgi:hypothetical protein